MKRIVDILISGITLLILLPAGLLVCLILRLSGEGKVWYRQPRVGKNGEHFSIFKFVTMLEGSEKIGNKDVTVRNDPRILPIGRFLRKTKINELPQLINVFIGDMSIVGWRPLVPTGFACYPEHVQETIVAAQPGLTGIGSIVFRDEEAILDSTEKELMDCYANDIAPYKGALEIWYVENRSFWIDFKIMFATAWVILFSNSKVYRSWFKNLPEPPSLETIKSYP